MNLKAELFEEKFQSILGFSWIEAKQFVIRSGSNLLVALFVLIVGWWFAKRAGTAVRKILTKSKTDAGLVTFLGSLTTIALKALVMVTAITQLGIEMTSFVAILGAAGLAVGMAFSGTLANFAGGVMILLFKPFRVGDTILVQAQQGQVREIHIFYTYLYTGDNKVIVLPNGPVANGNIVNFTRERKRRVDWHFSICYGDDYVKAHQVLLRFLEEDKKVFKDPAPFVALGELNQNAVNITVRAWAKTDDFWPVFYGLNERVYAEFKAEGLNFPVPPEAKNA